MDTNNISTTQTKRQTADLCKDHTPLPHWTTSTRTVYSPSHSSSRKLYMLLTGWALVLGITVAASLVGERRFGEADDRPAGLYPDSLPETMRGNAFASHPQALGNWTNEAERPTFRLLKEPDNSMPSAFRHTQPNVITHAEWLEPIRKILAASERPLRILQIGDSHVAGKSFPQAIKAALTQYIGAAESNPENGEGMTFHYFGKNGATSQHFRTDSYMQKFATQEPDLIILSLGTNEAHGMGYREDLHESQLDQFFELLRKACPDAVILLTTPPGDYLTRSFVDYRQTSRSHRKVRHVRRSKQPNPMSARCAQLIKEYGEAHQMPVWDLYHICGGEEAALRNWVSGNYMRPDRIHFHPQGYTLHGKLLAEALVQALRN